MGELAVLLAKFNSSHVLFLIRFLLQALVVRGSPIGNYICDSQNKLSPFPQNDSSMPCSKICFRCSEFWEEIVVQYLGRLLFVKGNLESTSCHVPRYQCLYDLLWFPLLAQLHHHACSSGTHLKWHVIGGGCSFNPGRKCHCPSHFGSP